MSGLVSREWLVDRIADPTIRVIDLRLVQDGGKAGYLEAHIPRAVYSEYAADGWRERVGDVPGLLPSEDKRAALFTKLGVLPDHHVVFSPLGTSANDLAASARAYWTLKVSGHQRISVLDGGTKGWILAGHPVESGESGGPSVAAYPIQETPGLRIEAGSVLTALRAGATSFVDARAASYFEGREKAGEAKRAGHIPGAISRDYVDAFDLSTGGLRPAHELARLYSTLPEDRPIISYCNTGHSAALNWFILSQVIGRTAVTLYDGSMTDWTQDEQRPVATNL